jgi:hypothetical protein
MSLIGAHASGETFACELVDRFNLPQRSSITSRCWLLSRALAWTSVSRRQIGCCISGSVWSARNCRHGRGRGLPARHPATRSADEACSAWPRRSRWPSCHAQVSSATTTHSLRSRRGSERFRPVAAARPWQRHAPRDTSRSPTTWPGVRCESPPLNDSSVVLYAPLDVVPLLARVATSADTTWDC